MNVEDNTSSPNSSKDLLVAEVSSTGSASGKSVEIAPEHQHHARAILAMDPVTDVPSTHLIPEGWGRNLTMRSTGLPPEMRREVAAKLHQLGNLTPEELAAKDIEFTAEAIRGKRKELIVKIGVGKDATPYHRELANIACEVADLYRQFDALEAELTSVARHDTETDPETGKTKAVPVYAISSERARGHRAEQQDILRRVRLLVKDDGTPGIEGAARALDALAESAAARAAIQEQLEDAAEAKRRATHNERERRINDKAELIGRMQRNGG